MSTINTNPLNVNYPVPGINNNSQGFRDNFQNIKVNLDIAANEITDLQNKAVLKSALANTSGAINNDMANTLISNASTRSFRSTSYNLGNALSGTVLVDASLADVFYGNVSNNISLQFGSWAPTQTQQTIYLQIGKDPTSNTDFNIQFPPEAVYDSKNFGLTALQNYSGNGNVSFPNDVSLLNLRISTLDCGNTFYIEPVNMSAQTAQIQTRTPPPTGFLGDVAGTVAVDADYLYVCTADYDAVKITALNGTATTAGANTITMSADIAPTGVTVNMPVVFDTMFIDGNSVATFGNIIAGQVYYVKSIPTNNTMTISETRSGGTAGAEFGLTTVAANVTTSMDATFYNGSDIWKRVQLSSW